MNIKFYNAFEKRANSTKQPPSNMVSDSYECNLLDATSVLNPVVLIEKLSRINPYSYSYAYIETFGRYYFVTDITSTRNLWVVSLAIDVLATYRHEIRNSTQYVLRSSRASDNDIVDGIYPTIAKDLVQTEPGTYVNAYAYSYLQTIPSGAYEIERRAVMLDGSWSVDRNYFAQGMLNGGYIVGIVSDNGTGVTYYAVPRSSIVSFFNKILTLAPSDITDVSSGYAKVIFNAIQYVVSVRWFPALPTKRGGLAYETEIKIAGYGIDVTGLSIFNTAENYIEEFRFTLALPNHPKRSTTAYGVMNWLNQSPYTQYNLYFAPFGNIPLDTTKLAYSGTLKVQWSIDFTTGASILKLFRGDYGTQLFYTTNTQLGVMLPVSSLTVTDVSGLEVLGSYLGLKSVKQNMQTAGVTNPVKGFFEGLADKTISTIDAGINFFKGTSGETPYRDLVESAPDVGGLVDFGVDAVASCLGQVQTVGKPDSFLSYYEIPFIYAWFLDIAEPDIERFGRPLNKSYTGLTDLWNGFVKCADSNVEFGSSVQIPTLTERNKVNSMLNTGVYLE